MIDRLVTPLLMMIFALFTFLMCQAHGVTLRDLMDSTEGEKAKAEQDVDRSTRQTSIFQEKDKSSLEQFSSQAVESKIQQELQEKYGNNIEVRFVPWSLSEGKSANVSHFIVEEIEVNQQRTKVMALVHFQIKGHLETLKIRGRLDHMIDIPTVNRPVHYGDFITKEDISWTKISGQKSSRFLITNPEDLIGRQPRAGFLKVSSPLYQRDVEFVRDIIKGSLVTALYKTAKLELQTKVRALEHGHKGENIRILNPDTNKIIYGVVVGPGHVSLSPLGAVKN